MKNNASAKGLALLSASPGSNKSLLGYGLASRLSETGAKVLFIDLLPDPEDLSIDTGHSGNFEDIMTCEMRYSDLVSSVEPGIDVLRGCTAGNLKIGEETLKRLAACISECSRLYDSILISAPRGINPLAFLAAGACEEIVITIDPEAPSIASAYCLLKALDAEGMGDKAISIFCNVRSPDQAFSLKSKFDSLTARFLNIKLKDGGFACLQQENGKDQSTEKHNYKRAAEFAKNARVDRLKLFQHETFKGNQPALTQIAISRDDIKLDNH